jgi:hypothetical protein
MGLPGINGVSGQQNYNPYISLTWGGLAPAITRLELGTWEINEFTNEREFRVLGNLDPAQEVTVRIRAGHMGAGTDWIMDIYQSMMTDFPRLRLFHSEAGYLSLRDIYWPIGRHFYATFDNPINRTDQNRADAIEARVSRQVDGGAYVFGIADTSVVYTNQRMIWVEEITLYRDPFDRDTGRAMMFAAANEVNLLAFSEGEISIVDIDSLLVAFQYLGIQIPEALMISPFDVVMDDDDETYYRLTPHFTGLTWHIYGPDCNVTPILYDTTQAENIFDDDDRGATFGVNKFTITNDQMEIFRNMEDMDRIRLVIFPGDMDFDNPNNPIFEEYIYVSHYAPRRIQFLPWQEHINAFYGDNTEIRFDSPAHTTWMTEGLEYRIRVWPITGDEREVYFFRCNEDRGYHFTPPVIDENFREASFDLSTAGLNMSLREPSGFRPAYLIYVSIYDPEFGWFGDYAYLFILPQPLRVNFDRPPVTIFSDEIGAVSFPFNLEGTNVSVAVNVTSINPNFSPANFSFTAGDDGGVVNVSPLPVAAGTLRDIYTVTIVASAQYTITNPIDNTETTGVQSRSATITFEVINSNALIITTARDNLTNIETISQMDSAQILALNRQINLDTFVEIDRRVYQWGSFDFIGWVSEDVDIAGIYRLEDAGWVNVIESGRHVTGARYMPMVFGYADGIAIISAYHTATGITADPIEINVATLQDQLYLISVFPQEHTTLTFYNSLGQHFEMQTDALGRIAIFEPNGIVGAIRFRSEHNGRLYLGTLYAASLITGEDGTGPYPMNNFRLRPVSTQTFFAILPDGTPYRGPVATWGGVFLNDELLINEFGYSIRPEEREANIGGSFSIDMDSTLFGDIRSTDTLEFRYEVHFLNGNWAPMLIEVDGFASQEQSVMLGNAILHLHPWDGDGFAAIRHTYDDVINEFDVTHNSSFVGPSSHDPEGILSAILVANGRTALSGLRYTDQFGTTPVGQTVELLNDVLPFLSGMYQFFDLQVPIDYRLGMDIGDILSFAIFAYDNLGVLHRNDLPFDILNLVGAVIPEDFYSLGFDLSDILADAGIFGSALGGATQVAMDLMNNLAPTNMSVPMPENAPFRVNITRSHSNPLLLEVRGYYTPPRRNWSPQERETDLRNHGYVYWIDTRYAYRFHAHSGCSTIAHYLEAGAPRRTQPSDVGPVGSSAPVRFRGSPRGRCLHASCMAIWQQRESEFNASFDQARARKWEATMTTSRSANFGIQGYFLAQIGWCIETRDFVLDFTRVSVTMDFSASFRASFRVKYMAGPVPISMVFTFEAGIGARIDVILEPSRMIQQGFGNRDWLTIRATTTGHISVTATAGVEALLLKAGVRARAEMRLRSYMTSQILVPNFAHRLYVGAEISIGAHVRIGPPWPGFLNWTWEPVFWRFNRVWRIMEGQHGQWNQDPWQGVSTGNLFPTQRAALEFMLFNELMEQRLITMPNPPAEEPILAVWDENFAIATWASAQMDEYLLERIQQQRVEQGLEPFDADNITVEDMIGLANLVDVEISMWDGAIWSEPMRVTWSTVANFNPVPGIYNDRAVVVWHQVTYEEEVLENDFVIYHFDGYVPFTIYNEEGQPIGTGYRQAYTREVVLERGSSIPAIGTTELFMATFDDMALFADYQTRPAIQNVGISIDGIINDHSVAINAAGDIAIALSAEIDDYDSIYLIHISANGQTTHSRALTDGSVNLNTQIEVLGPEFGGGFIFSYFTTDTDSMLYVMLGRVNLDGSIDHDFRYSVHIPSPEYGMFTNGQDVVVAWAEFCPIVDGFGVYAVKLVGNGDSVGTSAPIQVVPPMHGMIVDILEGVVTSDPNGAIITILYETIAFEDIHYAYNGQYFPSFINAAYRKFANTLAYEIGFSVADTAPRQEFAVQVDIANMGFKDVTRVDVMLNGATLTLFNGQALQPAEIYFGNVLTTHGDIIENIPYSIVATFSNGATYSVQGVLEVALPNVSLGNPVLTKAQYGMREFAINFFNDSHVPLAGSGNAVRLRFYHDPSLSLPAIVEWLGLVSPLATFSMSNTVYVYDSELLYLLDNGGLSLLFRYVIEDEDLNEYGEIFSSGKRIFVVADIVNSYYEVQRQSGYLGNHASIMIESLMRPNLPNVVATVNTFDTQTSEAIISLQNLSMNRIAPGQGRLIALITDALGNVVERQIITVAEGLQHEGFLTKVVTFNAIGAYVVALFEPLSADSTLSSLTLSGIPFVFDRNAAMCGDRVYVEIDNVHNVFYTNIIATTGNPNASIAINGQPMDDIAQLEIGLVNGITIITITTTYNGRTTTYVLRINSVVPEETLFFSPNRLNINRGNTHATSQIRGTAVGTSIISYTLPASLKGLISVAMNNEVIEVALIGDISELTENLSGDFTITAFRNIRAPEATLAVSVNVGTDVNEEPPPIIGASISPSRITFNLEDAEDIVIRLTPRNFYLRNLRLGTTVLVRDRDFSVNGNVIIIYSEFLNTLSAGRHVIIFEMSGGTNPRLTIVVLPGEDETLIIPAAENHENIEAMLYDSVDEIIISLTAGISDLNLYGKTLDLLIESEQSLTIIQDRVRIVLSLPLLQNLRARGDEILEGLDEDYPLEIKEGFYDAESGMFVIRVSAVFADDYEYEYDNDDVVSGDGYDEDSDWFSTINVSIIANHEPLASFYTHDGNAINYAVYVLLEAFDFADVNSNRLSAVHEYRNIGGHYNPATSWFRFVTHNTGEFDASYVEDLVRLELVIGSHIFRNFITGETSEMDVVPTIQYNRTLVPVRFIAEAFDADVSWDGATRAATIVRDSTTITLVIDQMIDGMDVPAQIIGNRTMVPLRFISEQLGATVFWDGSRQAIEIVR